MVIYTADHFTWLARKRMVKRTSRALQEYDRRVDQRIELLNATNHRKLAEAVEYAEKAYLEIGGILSEPQRA